MKRELPEKCPVCAGELTAGSVYLGGTAGGFMLFGASYDHCWFRARTRARSEGDTIVVHHERKMIAGRCAACGTMVVLDEPCLDPPSF